MNICAFARLCCDISYEMGDQPIHIVCCIKTPDNKFAGISAPLNEIVYEVHKYMDGDDLDIDDKILILGPILH